MPQYRRNILALEGFYPLQVYDYDKNQRDLPSTRSVTPVTPVTPPDSLFIGKPRNILFSNHILVICDNYPYERYLVQKCAVNLFSKRIIRKSMVVYKKAHDGCRRRRRIRFLDNNFIIYSFYRKRIIHIDSIISCSRDMKQISLVTNECTIEFYVSHITVAMAIVVVLG